MTWQRVRQWWSGARHWAIAREHLLLHPHLVPQHLAQLAIVAVVALLGVVPHPLWRAVTRYGITAAHEAGHAIVATVFGNHRALVRLRTDTSGATWSGQGCWPVRVLVGVAGYPAPGALGVAGAYLMAQQAWRVWLWFLLALGAVMALCWVRNVFGWLIMAALVAVTVVVLMQNPIIAQPMALLVCIVLSLGGVRAAFEIIRHPVAESDVAVIGRLCHLPVVIPATGLALAVMAEALVTLVLLVRP